MVGSTVGASGLITATVTYSVSVTQSYSETRTQTVDFDICNGELGQAYFNPYFVRTVGHFESEFIIRQHLEGADFNMPKC